MARYYRKRDSRRSRRYRTRRRMPWAGWGKEEPRGHERTVMLRDCGKKCFLGPRKSFPICTKGTCKVNSKGVYAAYIRARQWGKKPSSYHGKARPTMRRRVYTRIARRANDMLYRMGAKRGGSRHLRRCPRGYSHKIRGQRRRWEDGVDRIVRHGRETRRCYRNRK